MHRKLIVAALAFIALGMPRSSIGVGWPNAADEFGRPVSELGILLAIVVVLYGIGTAVSAAAARRFGADRVLIAATALSSVGLVGAVVAPSWPVALAAIALTGFGGGLLDAAINTNVAIHHGARVMGLMHAAYGIGATLGPLAMTLGLHRFGSWRPAYLLIAGVQIVVCFGFVVGRRDWQEKAAADTGEPEIAPVVPKKARNLAVGMFALLAAVETSGAQWGFSLLNVERGMSESAAGLAVTGYYAALTGVRLLLGVVGDRIDPVSVVRSGTVVALLGAGLLWWGPTPVLGAAGLVVLGIGIGPLFPLGMTLTPQRVGVAATPKVVGYQLVAANVGAAAYPALISLSVDRLGLAAVGPAVAIGALALVIVSEATRRLPTTPTTALLPPAES